jgi:hypothetical protein
MKKLLIVLAIGAFAACNNGTSSSTSDSTTMSADTTMGTMSDTSSMMMDTSMNNMQDTMHKDSMK